MILLSRRAQPQTDIGYVLVTDLPESRKLRIHKVVMTWTTGGATECSRTYPATRLTQDWDKVTCQRCLSKIPRGNLR